MDEALEEVALRLVGGPPRQLQLLVRVEVAARSREREAAFERLV